MVMRVHGMIYFLFNAHQNANYCISEGHGSATLSPFLRRRGWARDYIIPDLHPQNLILLTNILVQYYIKLTIGQCEEARTLSLENVQLPCRHKYLLRNRVDNMKRVTKFE